MLLDCGHVAYTLPRHKKARCRFCRGPRSTVPSHDRIGQEGRERKRELEKVAIFIEQSQIGSERVRQRRKSLPDGPVTLSLRLGLAKSHGPVVERPYKIECEDARAVSYVRYRLGELMRELDGTVLLTEH